LRFERGLRKRRAQQAQSECGHFIKKKELMDRTKMQKKMQKKKKKKKKTTTTKKGGNKYLG